MEIILFIVVLIAAYLGTQWGVMRMTKRACRAIIKDLNSRRAYTAESAVSLPYAQKKGMFHIGLRDYKPHALQYLLHREMVRATDDGRFYLADTASALQDMTL